MRAAIAFSAFAIGQSAQLQTREKTLEATWEAELDGTDQPETKQVAKKNPIQRVIGMLKDMKSQLEEEAAKEAEMYDQMVCWCETNEKEKTKAIADAEAKDKDLQAEIEARSARFGSVSTEIEAMKKQIDEDVAAGKQALAIRENENKAFRDEEKDLIQNIQNLENAIDVMKKHQGAALVQLDAPTTSAIHSILADVSEKYELMMASQPQPKGVALMQTGEGLGKQLMTAFGQPAEELPVEFATRILERAARQASSNGFLQSEQPTGARSYSAASNQVFGIMETMLEDMKKRLATLQKDEEKAKEDYENLAAANEQGVDTAKEKLDEMQGEDAGNGKALSDAKEDLELTRKQRSADVKFLRNLKLTCQDLDRQWEERSKTRGEEIKAVSEALAIITEDENREMLYKAQGFIQISASTEEGTEMQMRRANAVASLRKAAASPSFDADDLLAAWHNRRSTPSVATGPRNALSTLAITVSLDGFEKVKQAMDKMVADLKAEQAEEVKLKEYCTENFNKNEKETFENEDQKEDLEAKMEELAALVEKFTQDIADAKTALQETETGILKASQDREKENAEFQVVVSDQRATQTILTKALNRLKDFYKKEAGGGAFVQVQGGQTPPVQFAKQKNNAGASPVMGMISQIVEDSKRTEAEAISTEKQAQSDYETFVKDSNDLIASLTESITEKTKSISESKAESENAKADHEATVGELELLAEHKAALHGECDFTLKNFDIRQKARLQEIEAIGQAKAILSGS
jgi:hypothetical protein